MKKYKNFSKFPDFELNPKAIILDRFQKESIQYIDLTNSNPTKLNFTSYKKIEENLKIISEYTKYEPNPKGNLEKRKLISEFYNNKNRMIEPENIFLTSGSSESISFVLKTFLQNEDEILIPKPGYPLYEYIIEFENGKFLEYNYFYDDGWKLDFKKLEKNISKNTKAMILTSPNNPCGFVLTKKDEVKLKKILIENDIFLIIDEVFSSYYNNYNYGNKFEGVNQIYLDGLSKSFGLPSFKLSWILLKGNSEFEKQISESLEIVSDTYLNVNSFSEKALEILFKENLIQSEIKSLVQKNFNFIKNFNSDRIEFLDSSSTWLVLLKLKNELDDEKVSIDLLENHFVNVHSGYLFDLENFLIISLLVNEVDFQNGIKKLLEYFK